MNARETFDIYRYAQKAYDVENILSGLFDGASEYSNEQARALGIVRAMLQEKQQQAEGVIHGNVIRCIGLLERRTKPERVAIR